LDEKDFKIYTCLVWLLSEYLIYLHTRELPGLVRSRKHVYRTSRISEEITIPYFHPIYLIVLEEANANPNFLVSRRRIPIHCPDLLPGSYKAGRETSMGQSSLVSVGQG
jgi:hypothetical protein